MVKKILLSLLILTPLAASAVWFNPFSWFQSNESLNLGAPISNLFRSIVPEADGQFNLGTTSPSNLRWNKLFLATSTTGCVTGASTGEIYVTGTACGSGSGGSDPFTHPSAGQSATTSLMLFNGQASSTMFSSNQAWFGGTGTTSINNAGLLTVGPGFVSQASSTVVGLFRAVGIGLGKAPSASIRHEVMVDSTYTQGVRNECDTTSRLGFSSFLTGDAQVRFTFRCDGLLGWGAGTAVTDTNLYRNAADDLKTDDSFTALKWLTIGTSTKDILPQVTIASSTNPQLSLSAGAGLAQWGFRNAGGNLYLSTTTVAGTATTSTAALTLKSSGVPSLLIGTSTPQITLKNGNLVLGGGSDSAGITGSSTISTARIQLDGMNNTGARVCAFIVGTAWVVSSGACNP